MEQGEAPFTFSAFTSSEVLYSALELSGLITQASSPGMDCSSDFARDLPPVGNKVRRSFSTFFAGSWFLMVCFGSLARMTSTA